MFDTLTKYHKPVWDEPETKKWEKTARDIQQMFYLTFEGKQWDVYQKKEYDLLRTKVCYALFGPPKDANDNFGNIENAYDEDKRDSGDKIKDKIIQVHQNYSHCRSLHVGIIFVYCKQDDKQFYVPIFRIRINETTEESYYVDTNCRVYESWNDWEKNNKLEMMLYCYPKPGFYTCSKDSRYKFDVKGDVALEFGTSPACDLISRIGRTLDVTSGVTGFIGTGVGVLSFFTPLAPIALTTVGIASTTSAAYGAARSVQQLVDKGTHDESLLDTESMMSALSVIMLPLHVGTSVVNSKLIAGARTGRTFTSLQQVGATFLNMTTVAIDASAVLIGFKTLYDKKQEGTLKPLDVLQFSLSVFFFSHTLIQPKTANGIIKKAQTQYFQEYKSQMTDDVAQKTFQKFIDDNYTNIKNGANITKTINTIYDPETFFKSVGPETSIKISDNTEGIFIINDELKINPNRFNQSGPDGIKEMLRVTKMDKNHPEYKKYCNEIMRNERIALEARRQETLVKMAEVFETDPDGLKNVQINNKTIFADLTGAEIDRMRTVFGDTARNYNKDIIYAAAAAAKDLDCNDVHTFGAIIELIALESHGKSRSQYRSYLADFQINPDARKQFVADVKKDCGIATDILKNAPLKFDNEYLAAYHYRKHGFEFGNKISMHVYLVDIPKDLFQKQYLYSDVYDQAGTSRIQIYANKNGSQFGVLKIKNNNSYVATVFSNQKFFENWETKLPTAKEYLNLTTLHYNDPTIPTTKFFDIFNNNILKDMGIIISDIQVHKRNTSTNLNSFEGNSEDIKNLRELANLLTVMTQADKTD
ncbi:uncharacterized protein LOC143344136 [Colletes latitarsis]|uniref:uncharacterized protein LOC143344136 n=1 Tax=Colletes latitarsis TaxID=2605962 RepID=UPI0040366C22